MKTIRKTVFLALTLAALVGLAGSAFAQSIVVGRVSPATGFPTAIGDGVGTTLVFCLDGPTFCAPDPVIVGNAQSEATGFGRFAAYFMATALAQPPTAPNVRVRLEFFVTATYNGAVADGRQMVDNGIRFDLRGLPDGRYKILHPWGQRFITSAGGRVAMIQHRFGLTADNFQNARLGPVKGFLRFVKAGPGHLGNLDVDRRVTGSPLVPPRNFVEIQGPVGVNIGGPAGRTNILRINTFNIEGKTR